VLCNVRRFVDEQHFFNLSFWHSNMKCGVARSSRLVQRNCITLLLKARNMSSEAARTFDRKQIKADQDYCVDLVQKRDREGYRK
jgi:hypothetical protein